MKLTLSFARPSRAGRPIRRPWARCWHSALLLCSLWVLAACGPGVGGTGTGQEHVAADFGATVAPLCTSGLADELNCPPAVNGARPAVGTQALLLADALPPLRATGRIDGSRIELSLRCEGWAFFGEWGVAARAPEGRFYGTGRGPGGRVQPAVLLLQALGGGALQASLQDANGQALAPSVVLQVVPNVDGAGACPA